MKPAYLLFILTACYDKGSPPLDTATDDTADDCAATVDLDAPDLERDDCDAAPVECQCACYAELGARDGEEAGLDCDIQYPTRLHTYLQLGIQDDELRACFSEAALDAWSIAYHDPDNGCPVPVTP